MKLIRTALCAAVAALLPTAFGTDTWTVALAGLAAVIGNSFNVMLKLRGGKQVEIELVAAPVPTEVIAARRDLQSQRLLQKGSQVFDRLSRQGTLVRVGKAQDGLHASASELADEDAAALSHFLATSRLRLLFAKLEAGGSLQLKLGIKPGTEDGTIEIVQP